MAVGTIAVGVLLLLTPGTAVAHSELESSSPAAGERLQAPPTTVRLTFNQKISPQFANLSVTVGSDEPQRLDARVDGSRVTARISQPPGSASSDAKQVAWTIGYRVVSADGHPISGTVRFRAPVATASQTPDADPSPITSPSAEPEEESAAPPPVDTSSDGDGASVMSTIIIGGLVAALAGGGAIWLVRARKQDSQG